MKTSYEEDGITSLKLEDVDPGCKRRTPRTPPSVDELSKFVGSSESSPLQSKAIVPFCRRVSGAEYKREDLMYIVLTSE
jgi:hypothetical protein